MSFLLDPSSPTNSTTSTPDSLTSFPGIAETNLTTVIDDASKSRIIPPTTPPYVEDDVDAVPLPKAPRIRRLGADDSEYSPSTADVSTQPTPVYSDADADAWPLESAQYQYGISPAAPSAESMQPTPIIPGQLFEGSTDGYTSGYSSSGPQGKQHTRSYSSSSSQSSSSSLESGSSTSREPQRVQWAAPMDTQTRTSSSIPRIHIESESLLFSHSLPPIAKDKGKGKERERNTEKFRVDLKAKAREREMERILLPIEKMRHAHHRRRSSGTVSKIRTRSGVAVFKIQEQWISRDFFLIIALCVGLSCACVLVARPAMMSLVGLPEGFILDDLD